MDATRITFRDYPAGPVGPHTFSVERTSLRKLEPGEALIENIYATVDPAQSRRMRQYENYIAPFRPGDLITGLAVGQVVESRSDALKVGDFWTHWGGWETHSIVTPPQCEGPLGQRADPAIAQISDYLGPLGGKGITAWIAVDLLGGPVSGQTVLVSAAAGAVGSIAGQLARASGANRVVGIAGGADKCATLVDHLGYDAAIDRHAGRIEDMLDTTLLDGIDLYVDNVGGALQGAVMERMRQFGRVVITGTVSEYGLDQPPPGPNLFVTVRRGFSIHGFLATQYYDRFETFRSQMIDHLATGRVRPVHDIVQGLENAGEAMAGMLAGNNLGQRLIQIAEDPTA